MTEILQIFGIILLLILSAIAYVLPPALVASGVVRMVFRWHKSWRLIVGAIVLALPRAAMVVLGTDTSDLVLYASVALVMAGAVLYWIAIRGDRDVHFLLEAVCLTASLIYVLVGVNWIVG